MRSSLGKRCLVLAVLVTLLLWTNRHDVEDGHDGHRQFLGTALSRHPPSLRVFRFVFLTSFGLFGTAVAWSVWEGNEGCQMYLHDLLLLETPMDRVVVSESSHGAVYPFVLLAALDLTIVSCVSLLWFTVASSSVAVGESSSYLTYTAPFVPLGLFAWTLYRAFVPWKTRGTLWVTLLTRTMSAPCSKVTFRDGFIGDLLTSTVRPLQDLVSTLFFLPLGLHAYWSSYTLGDDSSLATTIELPPVERNWILHTFVLPACILSPQWWRFCQNLRQCYDAKQRWPYLGNAFKYMFAALVATFGMFDPSIKQHPLWIGSFVMATMYQVWWDVVMDWGLLESDEDSKWCRWMLRSERLYQPTWMYILIFVMNVLLRFMGMFTLLPPVYLSRTTGRMVQTFPNVGRFTDGSMAACAEIVRRTIWALLRLEWEVIQIRRKEQRAVVVVEEDVEWTNDHRDLQPMAIESSLRRSVWENIRFKHVRWSSDMSDLNDIQILTELCVWATMFTGLAIVAAAHREVL